MYKKINFYAYKYIYYKSKNIFLCFSITLDRIYIKLDRDINYYYYQYYSLRWEGIMKTEIGDSLGKVEILRG